MVSRWYKTAKYRSENFRLCFIFGLTLLLVYTLNIFYYKFFVIGCAPHGFYRINYNFQESEDDVLSDLSYAKTIIKPDPESQKDENYRNQMIYYQKKAAERSKRLEKEIWQFQMAETYIVQLNCPSMVRLGPPSHGGYGVCNPWVLAKSIDPCVMFSFGVKEEISFEQDFYDITGQRCRIYLFDEHEELEQISQAFGGTFMRAMISDRTNMEKNQYSIIDLTKKFGYDKKVDVLKIDIEGAEFSALPSFLRKYKGTVCQILIELHANEDYDKDRWLGMLRMLERRGYFVFNRESNQRMNRLHQYSYLHISCFEQYGLSNNAISFTYFI